MFITYTFINYLKAFRLFSKYVEFTSGWNFFVYSLENEKREGKIHVKYKGHFIGNMSKTRGNEGKENQQNSNIFCFTAAKKKKNPL